MPSFEAQAALIKRVYESHGLDYGSTQYVEAHGTGTKAGDPIEAEAIYTTIGKGNRKGKLWVGSNKPNVSISFLSYSYYCHYEAQFNINFYLLQRLVISRPLPAQHPSSRASWRSSTT